MSNKLNIFNSLPQYPSDDEEERTTKKVTGTKQTDKPRGKPAVQKEDHTKAKETRKTKGVSEQPHPLDRHSGTGSQAYGGKPKKGGAGKGNWGKTTVEGEAPVEAVEGEETTEQVVEEEKPSLTLQEYYEKHRLAEEDQEVNEAKAKITSDHLLKELGKATAIKSRNQERNDDLKIGKKKGHLNINHHAGISTEHADLLGFRTGFVEKEYRQRKEGEELPPRREFGQRRGERKERENAKEEETPAQPTTTAEGETASPTEQAEGQEKRREGGQRRGDGNRGGNRGGQRGGNQGPRKPYVPRETKANVNVADESAFPKLG